MEVIMTSPVQECLMMENGGGDGSAKLTKTRKRRQKKKVKLNAENPNSSLGTTASVDQKHAVSIPASGDSSTGSKKEDQMETSSNKMISGKTATPDAKTVSKGEEDTKVANGEMGSDTTATDNTVSKKRKRQRKKKNETATDMVTLENSSRKIGTDDVKMVSKGEDDTEAVNIEMVSDTAPTDNTVSKKRKSKRKKKNQASDDMVTVDKDSSKTATHDLKIVSKGEDDTKAINIEMVSDTAPTDNTVSKKRKSKRKKKNQASDDMVTVDKDSSKTATHDLKMVSKGEEDTKAVNGDANTVSKKEDHMETSINKMISGNIATPDAKTVSKGKEDTKVVNDKMVSETTPTDNTVSKNKKSKKKKKKKNQASNDMVTVENNSSKTGPNDVKMVSEEENHTKVTSAKKGNVIQKITQKNPQYLELMEPGVANIAARSQNKKIQEKKKQEVKKHEVFNATMDIKRVKMESVIQTGKEKVSGTTKQGKKLLIFDINGLLADIVSPRPKDVKADKYIPKRAIFKRPYLDGFLRFCFERFNVGIWSSRTMQVLYPVVNFLFGDLKKNLLFIWDNSFCTKTGMKTLEDKYKPMVFKDLRKIWLKNGVGNSWVKGTFHESNTLLLDDSPYKALLNPKNTAIFPLTYSYKDRKDDFLGPNGDLRRYLEGLAESDDVKTYVEQHPFGQSPIDRTHPHWTFYQKALRSKK